MEAYAESPVTAEQLLEMGDIGPCELVRGSIVPKMPTDRLHSLTVGNVYRALDHHVRSGRLGEVHVGEVGVITSRGPDTVRGADVAFISADRAVLLPEEGYLTLVPDLVVEVRSRWDRWADLAEKAREYLDGGARLVWVLDPRRQVAHVFRPDDAEEQIPAGETLSGGDVLPGFEIPLDTFFRD